MIQVVNWSRFQHYKGRRPPWIKLYRDLLERREWHALSGDASKLLVECWLIAAEFDGGSIPMDVDGLAWRLRRNDPARLSVLLQELVRHGFVTFSAEDASGVLADCKQDATPEESRVETETEKNLARPREGDSPGFELDVVPDGSDFVHPAHRLAASQVMQAWESQLPQRVAAVDRGRHMRIARQLADGHSAQEIALAFLGIGQLYPHSNGEPWDLSDLARKFTKAVSKARDHPELRKRQRESEILQILEAG